VSWSTVSGATSYEVQRSTSSGSGYASIGTTSSTSYDDTTATPETTYYYKIRAQNTCGWGGLSDYDDGWLATCP
jgi:fibronectin type 3 domain-containing protein